MSLVQVRQAGSVKMLEPRGKQWEVTLKDAFCPIPFTHCKCSAWTGLVSRHEDLFLPLYIRASVQMAEMGWSSPTQLRGFSLSRIHCPKKNLKAKQMNNLVHFLCGVLHLTWVTRHPLGHCSPPAVAIVASMESLPKGGHRGRPMLWSLALNQCSPKMFRSHWKHNRNTAENCQLLNDSSPETPPWLKEGKYCSLQAYGSHKHWGEFSRAQEENFPCAEKLNTNSYSVHARRTVQVCGAGVFNCYSEARAGFCWVLAKPSSRHPAVLPELSAEVSISTPRGQEGESRHTVGMEQGTGTHSPRPADGECFLFQYICKVCYELLCWGFFLFFCILY